jgi:tetratricopeptide (TPR) repeat protein
VNASNAGGPETGRTATKEYRIAPPPGVSEQAQQGRRDALEQVLATDGRPELAGEVRLPATALGLQPGDVTGDPLAVQRQMSRYQRSDAEIGLASGAGEFEKKFGEFDRLMDVSEDANQPVSPSFLATTKRIRELFQKKQFEDALVETNEVLLHYPKSALLWLMKGTLHLRLNQAALSLAAYEKAFDLEPDPRVLAQIEQLRRLQGEREALRQKNQIPSPQPVTPSDGGVP